MTTAAPPSDILRAVERWARVRGFAFGGSPHDGQVWQLSPDARGTEVNIWHHVGEPAPPWTVSPAIALAFALLVESGAASVDVGRCPACVARSGPRKLVTVEWDSAISLITVEHFGQWGWVGGEGRFVIAGQQYVPMSRPCPACTGTGRETLPAQRLLLDAVPVGSSVEYAVGIDDHFAPGWQANNESDGHTVVREECPPRDGRARFRLWRFAPGVEMSRPVLLAHADQLQATGDPLGTLLAWALTLWTGEPTTPIRRTASARLAADAYELLPIDWAQRWESERDWTVAVCQTGTDEWTATSTFHLRGHPHTAEALRWLEWLTWAREFAAEREALLAEKERVQESLRRVPVPPR